MSQDEQDVRVFDVANYLLNLSPSPLLKLIKMCYLCYGWHLAINNKKLFPEPVQAWKYGPVIPELYYTLKFFRGAELPQDCLTSLARSPLDEEQKQMVKAVHETYKKYSGVQLSSLTHQPGTPWDNTYKKREPNLVINDAEIQRHFRSLQTDNG